MNFHAWLVLQQPDYVCERVFISSLEEKQGLLGKLMYSNKKWTKKETWEFSTKNQRKIILTQVLLLCVPSFSGKEAGAWFTKIFRYEKDRKGHLRIFREGL